MTGAPAGRDDEFEGCATDAAMYQPCRCGGHGSGVFGSCRKRPLSNGTRRKAAAGRNDIAAHEILPPHVEAQAATLLTLNESAGMNLHIGICRPEQRWTFRRFADG
jgi:hypothetical protein